MTAKCAQVRVLAQRRDVVRDLHRVVGPVGQGDDGEVAAVGDVDLHVVRVGGADPVWSMTTVARP